MLYLCLVVHLYICSCNDDDEDLVEHMDLMNIFE